MTVFMSVIMSDKSTFAEYDSQSEGVEYHSGMLSDNLYSLAMSRFSRLTRFLNR